MRYEYKKVYEKHAAFFRKRTWGAGALAWASRALTVFFALAYAALGIVLLVREEYKAAFGALVAFGACLCLVWVLRLAVNRARPFEESGAGIVPLVEKKKVGKSFPSRHLSCACCIATLFLPFAIWAAIPLYLCACALAYARFALGWHYPSDLLGGGVLGVLCGLLALLF